MHIDRKRSRIASLVILTLALIGAGAAATHPAAAAATIAAIQGSVTCATSGGCISATNTGSGQGVTGTSKESFGLVGVSTLSSGVKGVSTSSSGILGITTSGQAGVRGSSVTNYGVDGSTTNGLAGVAGFGSTLGNYGVYGYTAASQGYAVLGYAPNGGFGVYGEASNGTGVTGSSPSGDGVDGASGTLIGVQGKSYSDYGVAGATSTGQAAVLGQASSKSNMGVAGYNTSSSGGYGVYGSTNTGGTGVYGTTPSGYGVVGTVTGIYGEAGVYGSSSTGFGVFGVSTSSAGLYGNSQSGWGVYASSNTGDGVDASSVSGAGLSASSTNGPAISATGSIYATGGLNAVQANLTAGESGILLNEKFGNDSLPLQFINTDTGYQVLRVDSDGDIFTFGKIYSTIATRAGTAVETYSPKTASPTVEDSGTAELVNGMAAVRLDPTFAAAIDPARPYRVFLTPDGDTNGLYVPQKTSAGFIVRESKGGRSTVSFDYRILADELGTSGQRIQTVALSALRSRAVATTPQHRMPLLHVPPAPSAPKFTAPKIEPATLPKPPPQSALPTH